LGIFADSGFSNVILQFSAHEYAFLHFTTEGLLDGEEINLKNWGVLLILPLSGFQQFA
jgi:hypothetical protein